MKLVMRKLFVVLIAIMTLGMYIPSAHEEMDAAEKKETTLGENANALKFSAAEEVGSESESTSKDTIDTSDTPLDMITEQAKQKMILKMGPRIIDKIENDFEEDILPKMEEVIEKIISKADEEEVPYYEITEEPTPGYGEKIFTINNGYTKEEVARFDVRREHRPGEGYWFHFHYHLSEDQFEQHHLIGDIYWDKNTPPKWMASRYT